MLILVSKIILEQKTDCKANDGKSFYFINILIVQGLNVYGYANLNLITKQNTKIMFQRFAYNIKTNIDTKTKVHNNIIPRQMIFEDTSASLNVGI